jgi:hypothetical protein
MSNKTTAVILVCFCLFAAMAAGVAYLLQDLPPTHDAARATLAAAASAPPQPTDPQPATAQPQFGPIAFGTGLRDGKPVENSATFPAGTAEVYAFWTYQHMADGMPFHLLWFHEDTQHREEALTWDGDAQGSSGQAYVASLAAGDSGSLPPGNYRLVLFIDEHQVQEAAFEILQPAP